MNRKVLISALLTAFIAGAFAVPADAGWRRRCHASYSQPVVYDFAPSNPAPVPAAVGLAPLPATGTPIQTQKFEHVRVALYELREAKQDVRDLKGIPAGQVDSLLGVIDNAIDQLKKCIEAAGGRAEYRKPDDKVYANDANYRHLRHAVRELKAAKAQLVAEQEIRAFVNEKGMKEIDTAMEVLGKAIEMIK